MMRVPAMQLGAATPMVVFMAPVNVVMPPQTQPGVPTMGVVGALPPPTTPKAPTPAAPAPEASASRRQPHRHGGGAVAQSGGGSVGAASGAAAPRRGAGGSRGGAGQPSPASIEVIAAVESLYEDQLKPFGRILRKRLIERAQGRGGGCSKKLLGSLRSICEASRRIRVSHENGGDWSATLSDREPCFVDFYSPVDVYPAEFWAEVEAYFAEGERDRHMLPGSRYECAQVLKTMGLPFAQRFSLGQLCHIVQLAISARKILGYLRGHIVPYRFSHSQAKVLFAEQQMQYSDISGDGCALVSWDMLVAGLEALLADHGAEGIALANLKHVFHSRYHLQISETALGYAKLSELLTDARLCDICQVRLEDRGYVVAPRRRPTAVLSQESNREPGSVPPPTPSGSACSSTMPSSWRAGEANHAWAPEPEPSSAAGVSCASSLVPTPGSTTPPADIGSTSNASESCQVTPKPSDLEFLSDVGTAGTGESASMGDATPSDTADAAGFAHSTGEEENGGEALSTGSVGVPTSTSCPLEYFGGLSVRNTFIHIMDRLPSTEGSSRGRARTSSPARSRWEP